MGTPSFGAHVGTCGGAHPPNASLVLSTAWALQRTGLAQRGYTLLELDDGWPADQRDQVTGEIIADRRLFPQGMGQLAAELAAMRPVPLYLGLYTDRGTRTCGGKPGSAGHEAQDASTYISWGVRQVKSDSCAAPTAHAAAVAQYALMQQALLAPFNNGSLPWSRSVFFSLCGWFSWYAESAQAVGNSYRVATDAIGWEQLLLNFDAVAPVARVLQPGHWPDMDMISGAATRPLHGDLGGGRGPGSVLARRVQTHFSMIAVTGSVLLLSFDVRDSRNAHLVGLVSNPRILAVHQDVPRWFDGSRRHYMRRLWGWSLATSAKAVHANSHCMTNRSAR
jgi:alpha-galactosidase